MKIIIRTAIGLLFCVGVPAANAAETAVEETPIVRVLKNRDVLPLDKTKIRRIAVIGPLAERVYNYDESGKLRTSKNPLQSLRDHAAPGTEVVYERGCALTHDAANSEYIQVLVEDGYASMRARKPEPTFSGIYSKQSLKLYAFTARDFIEFSLEVPKSGRYEIKLRYDTSYGEKWDPWRGIYQLSIDGVKQGAPVDFYNPLSRYDRIADFGSKNFAFAGRKKFRFTVTGKNADSKNADGHFDALMLDGPQNLKFELEEADFITRGDDETASIARAATLARTADVALIFVGSTDFIQRSGVDRGLRANNVVLTGNQGPLVRAVLAANPRTIVIEINREPLQVPWFDDHVPTILHLPVKRLNDNGSRVLAAALFGESE